MFFRREKPRTISFDERLETLKAAGFQVQRDGAGKTRVSKLGCAALLDESGVSKAGIAVGSEIGLLEHGGFQMFFRTPGGKRIPALAQHLKALHDFEEDLKEALGMVSLYNTSLGTRCDRHMYDRVKGRDAQ